MRRIPEKQAFQALSCWETASFCALHPTHALPAREFTLFDLHESAFTTWRNQLFLWKMDCFRWIAVSLSGARGFSRLKDDLRHGGSEK